MIIPYCTQVCGYKKVGNKMVTKMNTKGILRINRVAIPQFSVSSFANEMNLAPRRLRSKNRGMIKAYMMAHMTPVTLLKAPTLLLTAMKRTYTADITSKRTPTLMK
jgi:hypothetical protein